MKKRENQMIQTRFRMLDQMGLNLQSKIASYRENAKNLNIALDKDTALIRLRKELKNNNSTDKSKVQEDIKARENKFKIFYNKDLVIITGEDSSKSFNITSESLVFPFDSNTFSLSNEFLLKNIDRPDVFEKILLIKSDTIIYSSFSKDLKLIINDSSKETGTKKSFFNVKDINSSDTIFLPGKGNYKTATIYSNRCYDVSLSDGDYKLFLKPVRIDRSDLYLCGLVDKTGFQRDKQSIPPWFIVILSLALLLIMLSLPFLKLKVMSRTEMIGTGTVVLSGIAFILGTSFLVFFLFFQATNVERIRERKDNLTALSDSISAKFESELDSCYLQLDEAENNKKDTLKNNILRDTFTWNPKYYPFFDYIFWLDATGMTTAQITPFSENEPFLNYSFRDYFKYHKEWFWHDTSNSIKKFRLVSMVSVTSGDYKTAISRPSEAKDNTVIVMTGRFYALIDPILPSGYKFCIIDKSGKVWFHSNKYQNLAENFIRECNDSRSLKAVLYADMAESINVNYYNNPHRIYIKPLESVPLYLVTMYDLRLEYAQQAQIFITTLVFISFLFIYLFVLLMILLLLKRYFINDNFTGKFQLELINYKKNRVDDYLKLIIYFIAGLILFCLIFPWNHAITILIFINIITVLFTLLFYHLYDFKTVKLPLRLLKGATILILAMIFIVFHYWIKCDSLIIVISVIGQILFMLIILRCDKIKLDIVKIKSSMLAERLKTGKIFEALEKKPERAYSLLILGIVILFGVVPILKFFDIASNLEKNISIRYGQYELALARETRNKEYSRYYKRIDNIKKDDPADIAHDNRKNNGIYTGFWNNTLFKESHEGWRSPDSIGKESLESLVREFRPVYNNDLSVVSKYMLINSEQNRSFYWNPSGSKLMLYYKSPTEDNQEWNLIPMVIESDLSRANILIPFVNFGKNGVGFNEMVMDFIKEMLLVVLFIVILILSYYLILFTCRRVFGLAVINDPNPPDFESMVKNLISRGNSVILVNPSANIGSQNLNKKIKQDFQAADFNMKYPKLSDTSRILLVKNPFNDYQDPEILANDLGNLNECIDSGGRLIIMLDKNPESLLIFYKDKIDSFKPADPKNVTKTDETSDKYRKTYVLLKSFTNKIEVSYIPVIYTSVGVKNGEEELKALQLKTDDESFKKLLSLEFNSCDYLIDMQKGINDYFSILDDKNINIHEKKRLLVYRISESAERYYHCLLENCSAEEKFVLLDLAFDALANIKNKPVIVKLLRRGLLRYGEESIEFMNESFRIFILEKYSVEDKHHLKKAMGTGPGNWTGYKYAIYLVILALFVFIFISNQDFIYNLNRMFVVIGASIGGITTLLNFMGKKSKET
jgi:hypothetical protein